MKLQFIIKDHFLIKHQFLYCMYMFQFSIKHQFLIKHPIIIKQMYVRKYKRLFAWLQYNHTTRTMWNLLDANHSEVQYSSRLSTISYSKLLAE